jgi:hypothetical protein
MRPESSRSEKRREQYEDLIRVKFKASFLIVEFMEDKIMD